jgi:hypothetical protein
VDEPEAKKSAPFVKALKELGTMPPAGEWKKFSPEVFMKYSYIMERCILDRYLMLRRSGSGLNRTEIAHIS